MEGKLTVEIQICISTSVCLSVCLYDMIKWGLTSAQKEHKTYTNEDNDDVWENVCFFFLCVKQEKKQLQLSSSGSRILGQIKLSIIL